MLCAAVISASGCSPLSNNGSIIGTAQTAQPAAADTSDLPSEDDGKSDAPSTQSSSYESVDETGEQSENVKENTSQPESSDESSSPDSSTSESSDISSSVPESSAAKTSAPESSEQESVYVHVHSFGAYHTTVEPDCTRDGKAAAECGCGKTIEKIIPALGHEYVVDHSDWSAVYYKCRRCGDEITEKKAVKTSKDINDLSVTVETEHTYDGKEFRPDIKIYDEDEDVTASVNIEYDKNAVEVGSYFLTIYMKGIYTGSRRYEYKIFPPAPKLELKKEGKDYYTVKWNNDGDMSGYVLEYDKNKDFSSAETIELKSHRKSCKVEGLEPETRYYFRIRAVKTVSGSAKYRSHWSNTLEVGRPHIEVIKGITYVDGILIANKTYSLPKSYDPGLLPETKKAFNKMAADAQNDGLYLWIVSGYRSYSTQYATYNSFVWDRGVAQADRCSARPGHSEHQTGLALDINTTADSFAGTPEAKWIEKNCWKYGFIIRYPKGKEDITGYKYEPWHVRYLGKDIAKKVYDSGLTLEEYLGIDSVYSY